MNDGSSTTSSIAAAQRLTLPARNLRPTGANPAAAFGDLLDSLTRGPETRTNPAREPAGRSSQAESESADTVPDDETNQKPDAPEGDASPPDDDSAAAVAHQGEPRPSDEGEGEASSGNEGVGTADRSFESAQAASPRDVEHAGSASAGEPVAQGQARVPRSDGSSPAAPTATRPRLHGSTGASADFTTESITRELTHAATVDVAHLARREMVDPKHTEKYKTLHHQAGPLHGRDIGPFRSVGQTVEARQPGVVFSEPPATEPRPMESGVVPQGVTRPSLAPAVNDTPAPTQPITDAPTASTVRASAVASQSAPARSDPTVAAAVQPGRVALLERLTGSAEAARGAVAALDRMGAPRSSDASAAGRNIPTPTTGNPGTREAVLNSVQRGLASVLTQGGGRMTVVLRPESLGEVRVRLEAKDGVVNARLSATTDAARRTLESGLDTLRTALESRGVRVESLRIDPPEAHNQTARTDHPEQSDADGRGGQREHAHGEGEARDGSERSSKRAARNNEPETVPGTTNIRGIWTELGIDAVA
jgi:flagellar hook-length control protein FliK